MEYPSRILPRSHYKLLTNLRQLGRFYLLHFVDPGVKCKSTRDIQSNISRILVPSRYVNGMSFSLYCRIKIEDMKYKLNDPLGSYQADWRVGMNSVRPKFQDVEFIDRRKVVSVKLSDVFSLRAKSFIGQDKDREEVSITIRPEHSPILVNFWHINLFLDVHKDSDNSIITCKKDRAKRMAIAMNDDFASIIHPASKRQKRYMEKSIYQ